MSNLKYTDEWLELSRSGKHKEAQEMYFTKLLPELSEAFARKHANIIANQELLISILGFSPEPIIMTAMAMKPSKHIVITTGENKKVEEILSTNLDNNFNLIRLPDETFLTMYRILKEQLILNSYSNVVLDITGGKKSMVASAAIFGKDYSCKIVYVDFSEYLEDLRKPRPGTEILNLVYDPIRDQPELKNQ